MKKPCRPADICAHLGDDYDRYLGAIVPPLFQNTLFTRKHEEHGYSYSRINNPTIEILEKKLAALEHAPAARVFASGMAAITATLSSLLHSGGHVLALRSAYHPVIGFLDIWSALRRKRSSAACGRTPGCFIWNPHRPIFFGCCRCARSQPRRTPAAR